MGKLTERLRKEFNAALRKKIVPMDAIRRGERNAAELGTAGELIADGHHPIHAIYKHMANVVSLFIEELVDLPFLHRAHAFFLKAQDLYTPGYPPLSPITASHYAHWTCFDVSFGVDHETFGECLLGVSDLLEFDPLQIEALEKLCRSHLGLYQIFNASGGTFRMRDMVTGREADAIIPSGFSTEADCMALVRVLPPLNGLHSPCIAVSTPYVIVGTSEEDWLEYFERQLILPGAPGAEERLHRHMKRGKDDWYWCEFLFYGFVNYRSDAIFVAGVPDRPETQPHHRSFDAKTFRGTLYIPG